MPGAPHDRVRVRWWRRVWFARALLGFGVVLVAASIWGVRTQVPPRISRTRAWQIVAPRYVMESPGGGMMEVPDTLAGVRAVSRRGKPGAASVWDVSIVSSERIEGAWAITSKVVETTARINGTDLGSSRILDEVRACGVRCMIDAGQLPRDDRTQELVDRGVSIQRYPVRSGYAINGCGIAGVAAIVGAIGWGIGATWRMRAWDPRVRWACASCGFDARTVREGEIECPACGGPIAIRDSGGVLNPHPVRRSGGVSREGSLWRGAGAGPPTWAWVWGLGQQRRMVVKWVGCVVVVACAVEVVQEQWRAHAFHGVVEWVANRVRPGSWYSAQAVVGDCTVHVMVDGSMVLEPVDEWAGVEKIEAIARSVVGADVIVHLTPSFQGFWARTGAVEMYKLSTGSFRKAGDLGRYSPYDLPPDERTAIQQFAVDAMVSSGVLPKDARGSSLAYAGVMFRFSRERMGWAINAATVLGLVMWVWGAVGSRRDVKRIMRARSGRCAGCSYDLRGQPAGTTRCPECGESMLRCGAGGKAWEGDPAHAG